MAQSSEPSLKTPVAQFSAPQEAWSVAEAARISAQQGALPEEAVLPSAEREVWAAVGAQPSEVQEAVAAARHAEEAAAEVPRVEGVVEVEPRVAAAAVAALHEVAVVAAARHAEGVAVAAQARPSQVEEGRLSAVPSVRSDQAPARRRKTMATSLIRHARKSARLGRQRLPLS